MSENHYGFSLPSFVEDSVMTKQSSSSGYLSREPVNQSGPSVLSVAGFGISDSAQRTLFHNMAEDDSESEESSENSRTVRREKKAAREQRKKIKKLAPEPPLLPPSPA